MQPILSRLRAFWFDEAPADRLALLRVFVGGFALWYLWSRYDMLLRIGRTDPALFDPVGLAAFLPAPMAAGLYQALVVGTMAAAVAFIVGWRFRWTGPLFAILFLAVMSYRNSWSMVYHSRNVVVLHALILAFVPAADALSWDAWRGRGAAARSWLVRRARSPRSDAAYGWPIRLICAVTVSLYFLAGVAKVVGELGWSWASGTALRSQIAVDYLRKDVLGSADVSPLAVWLFEHVWLFTILAIVSLVVELGAPLVLAKKRWGRFWALNAWLMHWGIFFVMGIRFRYQMSGLLFASFFDVEKPVRWVRRWARRRLYGLRGPETPDAGAPEAAPAPEPAARPPVLHDLHPSPTA